MDKQRKYRSNNKRQRSDTSKGSDQVFQISRSSSTSSRDSDRVFMGPGSPNAINPPFIGNFPPPPPSSKHSVDNLGYDSNSNLFHHNDATSIYNASYPESENTYLKPVKGATNDQYASLKGVQKGIQRSQPYGGSLKSTGSSVETESTIYETIPDDRVGLASDGKKKAGGKRRMRCVVMCLAIGVILVVAVIGAAVGIGIYLTSGGDDGCSGVEPGTWDAWIDASGSCDETSHVLQSRACQCKPCSGSDTRRVECIAGTLATGTNNSLLSSTTTESTAGQTTTTTTTTTTPTRTTTAPTTTSTTLPPVVEVTGPIDLIIIDDTTLPADKRNMVVEVFNTVIQSLVIGDDNVKIAYHNLPGPYGWPLGSYLAKNFSSADGIFYNRPPAANDAVYYHYSNVNMFDSIVLNLIDPGDRPPRNSDEPDVPNIAFIIWDGNALPSYTMLQNAARVVSIATRESDNAKAIVQDSSDFLILGEFTAQDILNRLLEIQP